MISSQRSGSRRNAASASHFRSKTAEESQQNSGRHCCPCRRQTVGGPGLPRSNDMSITDNVPYRTAKTARGGSPDRAVGSAQHRRWRPPTGTRPRERRTAEGIDFQDRLEDADFGSIKRARLDARLGSSSLSGLHRARDGRDPRLLRRRVRNSRLASVKSRRICIVPN